MRKESWCFEILVNVASEGEVSLSIFFFKREIFETVNYKSVCINFFEQGTSGLEKHVDTLFDNVGYFTEYIRNREGFKLVLEQHEFVNICFWYIPPSLRGVEHNQDYESKLHKVSLIFTENWIRLNINFTTC